MPAALQTLLWLRHTQWFLRECGKRFGPTFTLQIAGQGTWVVVSDPEDVKAVFQAPGDVLHAGEGNRVMEPVVGRNSVLLLDGDAHLEQRRLLLPAFGGGSVARYGPRIAEIAASEIDAWPRGTRQRLLPRFQAMTLEVILDAVLGVTDMCKRDALRVELRRMLGLFTDPWRAAALIALGPRVRQVPRFRRLLGRVDELLYTEIAERRREGAERSESVIGLLAQARHEDGSAITDEELRDELMTLLLAGHETTATALAWACERLARHPAALARLTDEARAGTSRVYVRAVIQETLRLRPVLSIVQRIAKVPFTVGAFHVPVGTSVVVAPSLVGMRPERYEDPQRFSPERFLGDAAPGTYDWVPFGGGVRRCLGAPFALYEMEVVLHVLAARRGLRPVSCVDEAVQRRAVLDTPKAGAETYIT